MKQMATRQKQIAEARKAAEEKAAKKAEEAKKKEHFPKRETGDLLAAALASSYAQFAVPSDEEAFDDVQYLWRKKEDAAKYLKSWICERKITLKMEELEPSEWFKGKSNAFQKALQDWQVKQKEFKSSAPAAQDAKDEKPEEEEQEEKPEEEQKEGEDAPKEDEEDLESLTVDQLKEKLKEAGLKVSGNKAELISRLKEAKEAAPEDAKKDEEAAPKAEA